jgi:uncharacterized membrane protein
MMIDNFKELLRKAFLVTIVATIGALLLYGFYCTSTEIKMVLGASIVGSFLGIWLKDIIFPFIFVLVVVLMVVGIVVFVSRVFNQQAQAAESEKRQKEHCDLLVKTGTFKSIEECQNIYKSMRRLEGN